MSDINIFIDSIVSKIGNQFPVFWKRFKRDPRQPARRFCGPGWQWRGDADRNRRDRCYPAMVAYLRVVNPGSLQREDTAQRLLAGGHIGLGAQRWGLPDATRLRGSGAMSLITAARSCLNIRRFVMTRDRPISH